MVKRICILTTNKSDYAPQRLLQEATKISIPCQLVKYNELEYSFSNNQSLVSYGGEDLNKYSHFIIRGMSSKYASLRQLLIMYLNPFKKKIINSTALIKYRGYIDKLTQAYILSKHNIPIISSSSIIDIDKSSNLLNYPLILKTTTGSHGRGVFKVENDDEYKKCLNDNEHTNLISQPFISSGEDYRIIVLGGRVLGIMRRKIKQGQYLTNVSAGGYYEKAEPNKQLEQIAVDAARIFCTDYCGVDIIFDENKNPYVLELNLGAQFKGFEECTKINVANKLIEYLLS